jgi:hypothetical protein
VVRIDLEVDDRDLVAEGDEVTVEMPGGGTVTGEVASVGTVAETGDGGQEGMPGGEDKATVEVLVRLPDDAEGFLDRAPVTVEVRGRSREDVLAVPVGALIALAGALQAVDGIALKVMVDRWAAASGEAQSVAFETAYAVRQVEIGLASFLSLVSGLTMIVFGIAITISDRYPTWLGGLAVVGGLGAIAGGLAQATTGFSDLAMMLSMPSSAVLLVWAIIAGVLMWRLAPKLAYGEPS